MVRRVFLVWEYFFRFSSTCVGDWSGQFPFMVCGRFFLSLVFVCPCGAVGFPLRAESVGVRVVCCISFGNVSFGFPFRFIGFQRVRLDRVAAGGSPFGAERWRVRVVGCVSFGNVSFDLL